MVHIRQKSDCKPFASDHGEIVYELMGNAAGGSCQHSLAHIEIPPGKSSLKHFHPVAEESYYILSGTAWITLDDKTYTLKPGQSIAIPPQSTHQIGNNGEEQLTFLAICAPGWTPDNSVFLED